MKVVWKNQGSIYRYLSKDEIQNNKVKIGKITTIYFGTPYEHLTNYEDIKKRHKKLQKYHKQRKDLRDYCKAKCIKCEDIKI